MKQLIKNDDIQTLKMKSDSHVNLTISEWGLFRPRNTLLTVPKNPNLFSIIFAEKIRSWVLWIQKRPHSAFNASKQGLF